MKENSCCFTGHRNIPANEYESLKYALLSAIVELIEQGVDTFYAGGALGFDTLAAIAIIKLKKKYPHIKLILALPCVNQTAKWNNQKDIEIYNKIIERADEHTYISQEYTDTCMLNRNRYMVDHCDYCIAYLNRSFGGSAYTYKYAKSNGLIIKNLGKFDIS